jgi:hypothetical protein
LPLEAFAQRLFCFRVPSPYCLIIKICMEGGDRKEANF